MNYRLENLLDITLFNNLLDKLNLIYSFPSAIIDIEGNILTDIVWQDICTKFYITNHKCKKECLKNDNYISELLNGENSKAYYQCPHGLINNATQIVIDGKNMGFFFTGPFFLKNPDLEFFRKQAKLYKFDENEYLEAVKKVHIWTKKQFVQYIDFTKGFVEIIEGNGLKKLKEIKANKIIKENEERYQTILQTAMDGFWLTDIHGQILEVNEIYCRMSGYSKPELLSMRISDLEAIETQETTAKHIQNVIIKGEDRFLSQHRRKDGSCFDIEISVQYQPSYGERLVVFLHDITERKQMEREIKESELRFKNMADASPSLIWMSGTDKSCNYFNKTWLEYTGRTMEQENGNGWAEGVHPDDLSKCLEIYVNAFDSRQPFAMEYRLRRSNSEYGWIYDQGVPRYSPDGIFAGYIGSCIDITERKQTELALKNSEERYRNLFENLPIGIYRTTPDGRILSSNPALVKMLGFPSIEECLKRNLEQIAYTSYSRSIYKEQIEREGYINGLEAEWRKYDNTPIFIRENARVVRDKTGKVLYYDGIVEDITERKKLENLNETLLSSLPHPAMYIRIKDKVILAANKIALELGVKVGGHCWREFGKANYISEQEKEIVSKYPDEVPSELGIKCSFCLGDNCFLDSPEQNNPEVNVSGLIWDAYWIKVTDEVCLHYAVNITERKHAEYALRESEERYRLIAENTADTIIVMNLQFEPQYISPSIFKLCGYTVNEAMTNPIAQILTPESLQKVNNLFEERIKLEANEKINYSKSVLLELEVNCKDGSIIWVELSSSLIRDNNLKPTGILAILRDITKRKQMDNELLRATEEIRDLYNYAPCGYHSLDKDGVIVRINETELEWLGYQREEVLGKMKFSDLLTNDSLETFKENFPRFKSIGKIMDIEFEVIRKDGSIMSILLNGTAITDKDGNYLMSRSTVFDITDRKLVEIQLRESEQKFRSLAESSPDNIIKYDINCRAIYINHNFKLSVSNDVSSEINKTPIESNNAPGAVDFQAKLQQVIESGQPDEMEIVVPNLGNELCHNIRFVPEYNSDGEIIGALSIGRDITSSKFAEKKLKESEERYRLIAENTADTIIVLSLTFELQYISPSIFKLCGYTVNETMANSIAKILTPESLQKVNSIFEERIKLEANEKINYSRSVLLELEVNCKDGSIIWVELSSSFIRDNNLKPTGILAVLRDINSRKKMEFSIQQQLNFANALNDIAGVIISTEDSNSIIEKTTDILGETLSVDRCLIYDVNFPSNQLTASSEWINTKYSDIQPTKGVYPIDIFISGITEMRKTRHYLVSNFDEPNPLLLIDNSDKILHDAMEIKSALWYPFAFSTKGYSLLVLNETHHKREWLDEEINFLNSVSKQVSIALEKINLLEERKEVNKKIEANEIRFKTVADYTYDWEYWEGKDNQLIYISPSCERISGYKPDEFLSDNLLLKKIIYPEDVKLFDKHFKTTHSSKHLHDIDEIDFRIIKKNGTIAYVGHLCRPVFDDKGNYYGRRVSNRDITKRKKVQEELIHLNSQKELILNSVEEGILGLDLQGRHTFVNPVAAKILGYAPEELIGLHSYSIWHHTKEDGSRYLQEECPIYAAFRNGKTHRVLNELFWKKDGTSFYVEYTSSPIYEHDQLVGAVVTFTDITERKLVEKRLHESEERLNSETKRFLVQGQEDERKRIAREIHDGLCQILSVVDMSLTEMKVKGIIDVKDIYKTSDLLKTSLNEAIRISNNLSPSVLVDFGLIAGLKKLVKLNSSETSKEIILRTNNHLERLPKEVELTFYRIAQEAIRNAINHSKCSKIYIIIYQSLAVITMKIIDNGKGIDEIALKNRSGFGLNNIYERAKLIRANATINSKKDKFTLVKIIL